MLLAVSLLSVACVSLARPRTSDSSNHAISIVDTTVVSIRDTSNLISEDFSYLSDTPDLVDDFELKSTPRVSDQPAKQIASIENSDVTAFYGLHLQSSTHSIVGVNGDTLYASLIETTKLLALLRSAEHDVDEKAQGETLTNLYQFNQSSWSFQVVVSDGKLHYRAIAVIIHRFIQLALGESNKPFIWTRVGCLYRGGQAMADVTILPVQSGEAKSAFVGYDIIHGSQLPRSPVPIMTVTPNGTINSTEVVNPNALDMYKDALITSLPKRQASSMEQVMALKVYDTGYYLTMGIRNQEGEMLRRAQVSFLAIPITLSLCRWVLGLLARAVFEPWVSDLAGESSLLDSGSYRLGQMSARFILHVTARDHEGKLVAFKKEVLKAMVNTLLVPLTRIQGQIAPIYAMGGEILGPDPVNGTAGVVTLGAWELTVDPAPAIVNDEL
ncbi:MAG: hypothetical protein Q9219_006601 [cf. Caloplaca sp. 3 TL-2023]